MLYTVRQQKIDNLKDKIAVKLVKKEKKLNVPQKPCYMSQKIFDNN